MKSDELSDYGSRKRATKGSILIVQIAKRRRLIACYFCNGLCTTLRLRPFSVF